MRPSDFKKESTTLKADEMPSGWQSRLTIKGFDTLTFDNDDGTKDSRCVILFEGKTKGIATGVQNLEQIALTHGDSMESWVGCDVEVWTAIKGNDKLGFAMRGVADGGDAPTDDIPF